MTLFSYWFNFETGLIFKLIVEFLACMMFHFIGSVASTPTANGVALIVLVYFTAKISGSHLNPCISTTFTLLGYTHPFDMLMYWMAQIAGCIVGAMWIAALVPGMILGEDVPHDKLSVSGCFIPEDGLTYARIYGWETLCTFCFILPIFAVVWYTQEKSGYGNTGPFIVGCSFIASALVAAPYTGAAFNPARVIGSRIVFQCPNNMSMLYYILGEMTAGIVAPFFLIPWYGISMDSWYFKHFPKIQKQLEVHAQVQSPLSPTPRNVQRSVDLLRRYEMNKMQSCQLTDVIIKTDGIKEDYHQDRSTRCTPQRNKRRSMDMFSRFGSPPLSSCQISDVANKLEDIGLPTTKEPHHILESFSGFINPQNITESTKN